MRSPFLHQHTSEVSKDHGLKHFGEHLCKGDPSAAVCVKETLTTSLANRRQFLASLNQRAHYSLQFNSSIADLLDPDLEDLSTILEMLRLQQASLISLEKKGTSKKIFLISQRPDQKLAFLPLNLC